MNRLAQASIATLTVVGLVFGLVAVGAPAAIAQTSSDGIVTLEARANTTVTSSTRGNVASYRITVDLEKMGRKYGVEYPSWGADVTVSGPGYFSHRDRLYFEQNSSGWQPIQVNTARLGTYTVTAEVSGYGYDYDDESGWIDRGKLSSSTVTQTFVLEAAPKVSAGTPAIAGTAKVGSMLTAKPGNWAAGTTFSYQWLANGKAIAKSKTLKLTPALQGKKIKVKVTGTKPGYTTVGKTSPAKKVAKGTLTAGTPALTGTANVGTVLTAKPGEWTAGTTFSYQWLANGKAIAKGKTLKLTPALQGKKIKVKVTGTNPGYITVSRTSNATTVTKPPATRTVLGQKNLFPGGTGWGTARPKTIFNGGDPSGRVSNIRWSNWGSKTAFGQGQSAAFKPGGGYYAKPVGVQLKASNIGRITKSGPRVYKHLTARFQKRPGGAWGKWSGWLNLRDGALSGRITR